MVRSRRMSGLPRQTLPGREIILHPGDERVLTPCCISASRCFATWRLCRMRKGIVPPAPSERFFARSASATNSSSILFLRTAPIGSRIGDGCRMNGRRRIGQYQTKAFPTALVANESRAIARYGRLQGAPLGRTWSRPVIFPRRGRRARAIEEELRERGELPDPETMSKAAVKQAIFEINFFTYLFTLFSRSVIKHIWINFYSEKIFHFFFYYTRKSQGYGISLSKHRI